MIPGIPGRRHGPVYRDSVPRTKASACPTYGGRYPAQCVLELGGEAARHGLKPGDTLAF